MRDRRSSSCGGGASHAAIIGDRRITGLSAEMIAELVAELGPLWCERYRARLASRLRMRGVGRGREAPAGVRRSVPGHSRAPPARVIHDASACWFGVDRSTITRAIGQVRPLLAERVCTVSPGRQGRQGPRPPLPPGSTDEAARTSGRRGSAEVLVDVDYQGLGTQTGRRLVTPPHRKSKKNALDCTRRCTNGRARHTPHVVTVSSTAWQK